MIIALIIIGIVQFVLIAVFISTVSYFKTYMYGQADVWCKYYVRKYVFDDKIQGDEVLVQMIKKFQEAKAAFENIGGGFQAVEKKESSDNYNNFGCGVYAPLKDVKKVSEGTVDVPSFGGN